MKRIPYWLDTEPISPAAPLAVDLSCDICVVGAGYTGLWTAYFLRQHDPGLDICVLEKEFAGAGGSGHNEGFVLPNLGGRTTQSLVAEYGVERTLLAYTALRRSAVELARSCVRSDLDVEFEAPGIYAVAADEAQRELLVTDPQMVAATGQPAAEILDQVRIQAIIGSPAITSGSKHPGGLVNPFKLTRRLADLARAAGVAVHEQTQVTEVSAGDEKVLVRTPAAVVSARYAVLATDAYQYWHPAFADRMRHVTRYTVVTEPLAGNHMERVSWAGRAAFVGVGNAGVFGRLTWDNRILLSGGFAISSDGMNAQARSAEAERRAVSVFRSYFPQLADLGIEYCYNGTIGLTHDLLPHIGALSARVFFSYGYSGNGIVASYAAARALTARMTGTKDDAEAIMLSSAIQTGTVT